LKNKKVLFLKAVVNIKTKKLCLPTQFSVKVLGKTTAQLCSSIVASLASMKSPLAQKVAQPTKCSFLPKTLTLKNIFLIGIALT
jgi:hypothetical protein